MIDLATAKQHLHVEAEQLDDDSLIQAYLNASIGTVQKATGKLLTQQPVTQAVAGFPCADGALRLWNGPVVADSVTVKYDDRDGAEQTLADFRLVEGLTAQLLPAYGSSWPLAVRAAGSVRVSYTAGYGADEVPPELDQAVLLLTGHYYANREAAIADSRAAAIELPLGIEMLLAPYSAPGIA